MRRRSAGTLLAVVVAFALGQLAAAAPPRLPHADPATVGMSAGRLAVIDEIVAEGLRQERMPGAVVLVVRGGRVVYHKAFGNRQVKPTVEPMTVDTLFDLASLTKPVATATSIMKLSEQGRLHPRDAVAKHLPEFGRHGKDAITIYQLLTHQGGLIADNALADYAGEPAKSLERICELEPIAAPGERFVYTDVGYIVLGEVVQRVSGLPLDEFAKKHVFEPLGMTDTGFKPSAELAVRAATTQQRDGRWMKGEVHDPRAWRLGGVAGHAGVFSTADDLAIYAQMLLGGGEYAGVRVLERDTVETMTTACEIPGGLRGLGWDVRTGYSSNRGDFFSSRAFGHGGFTGTALWIDPELDLAVIFLSNRVHPDGKGSVNPLAGRIGTIAAAAIDDDMPRSPRARTRGLPVAARGIVLTGIDVLARDNFRPLAGRRIGLITNQTGVDRSGRSTVELLRTAEGIELAALFSPEHGFKGELDQSRIADSRDDTTGLRIYSLYGATREPTPEMLQGLDTLVFDIQDIGTRFYTYISTMGLAMRAAAKHKLRFVVLDRPNPIGGRDIAGPVLDEGSESFVAFHRLPVRHGMTAGELARLFNEELQLGLDLEVVRCEGWRREDYYDATGLTWTDPSPNMRSLRQAVLYPGIGLLETTNLSVGRGTDTPFEVLGAPWIDGRKLAAALDEAALSGVAFVPVSFTPEASKYAGERCGGIEIIVTDRDAFEPVRTGLEIARQLRRLSPDDWNTKQLNRLLGSRLTHDAILAGKSQGEIELLYKPELDDFRRRREPHLLYR
ncbi:MAG: DUF1343 domain-containing protein [Planctomycetes bacterium]|nr:DUF1343 domain-containing protein [Planctomycetota bacterium]